MSSNTKIVVLRSKELIYTFVLLVVVILAVVILLSIFLPGKSDNNTLTSKSCYIPGIYSSSIQLGNTNAELHVALDCDHINSISLISLDETVETMYPLVGPTLNTLAESIVQNQSLTSVSYDAENKYTSLLLLNGISEAINKAKVPDESNEDTATTGIDNQSEASDSETLK